MIKIAICDDDHIMLKTIYDKILHLCNDNGIENTLEKFLNPIAFKDSCSSATYDLVFLDINMTPISGLDLAEYLNTHFPETKIVFISSYNDVVYETFKYSPLTFIRKDHFDGDIENNINLILRKLKLKEKYISIPVGSTIRSIRIMDICYVQSSNNNIIMYMKDETELITRKTFKSFLEEVNSEVIIQINKGLLINLSFVNMADQREVRLINDETFSISRNYSDYFKQKYFQYCGDYR